MESANGKSQRTINTLNGITSLESQDDFNQLDETINQLFASKNPKLGISALLEVFERFPSQDGAGTFWSIVHGLESLPGYDLPLIKSVKRQPAEFNLLMINRLLNGGVREIQGLNLLDVLKEVAAKESQTKEIRTKAQHYVEWQQREK